MEQILLAAVLLGRCVTCEAPQRQLDTFPHPLRQPTKSLRLRSDHSTAGRITAKAASYRMSKVSSFFTFLNYVTDFVQAVLGGLPLHDHPGVYAPDELHQITLPGKKSIFSFIKLEVKGLQHGKVLWEEVNRRCVQQLCPLGAAHHPPVTSPGSVCRCTFLGCCIGCRVQISLSGTKNMSFSAIE